MREKQKGRGNTKKKHMPEDALDMLVLGLALLRMRRHQLLSGEALERREQLRDRVGDVARAGGEVGERRLAVAVGARRAQYGVHLAAHVARRLRHLALAVGGARRRRAHLGARDQLRGAQGALADGADDGVDGRLAGAVGGHRLGGDDEAGGGARHRFGEADEGVVGPRRAAAAKGREREREREREVMIRRD